ncbi:DUF937 domain-containing protein [Bradyrhizobium lablabi]|uniref:DUF937 domain-containing protein n=1 Tax=Bradyrhizobium lablabi TaxID=722472 RepID=UPI001BA681F2|nr:DUF937 domain-containing protein [Bradyrhizobium lablabi]MBR0697153.1 DUF937 domain-containing protein [Bradyrhizobium lablabi]
MATNLVQLVTQLLTPDMITKIAAALGLDSNLVQKMIAGAVPSLLASVADVASTPTGARQLTNTLSQQQPGSLDGVLASLTQGSGADALMSTGSRMLSGLFGGGALDTMSQAIGESSGVSKSSANSLLSMLGPVVLGALGRHASSAGLDTNGLASLLTSQKRQIAAAIPSGIADRLTATGLIDDAGESLRSGAATASAAAGRMSAAGSQAAARASGTTAQWPYWLLGVAVLAGLAWYAMGPQRETVAELPRSAPVQPATTTVGAAPTDITVGNLTGRVNSSVDSLKSLLPSIKDAASAQSALPKLQEATNQLSEVNQLAGKLNPEGRSALAKLIAAAMPTINEMCEKALATPGVGPVAKPMIDELRGKLDALSRA